MEEVIKIISENLIEIGLSCAAIVSIIFTRGKNAEKIQEKYEKKKEKAKAKAAKKAQKWANKFKELNKENEK